MIEGLLIEIDLYKMFYVLGEEKRIQSFGGETNGKRPLERPRRRWVENIRMDLKEVGSECVDWVHLAGSCEHGNEPLCSIKCWKFLTS
jgi:hypothetical protein